MLISTESFIIPVLWAPTPTRHRFTIRCPEEAAAEEAAAVEEGEEAEEAAVAADTAFKGREGWK